MNLHFVKRVKIAKGLLGKCRSYSHVALPFTDKVRNNVCIGQRTEVKRGRLVGWLVGCLGFMAYQPL